jgi:hypothetical protein
MLFVLWGVGRVTRKDREDGGGSPERRYGAMADRAALDRAKWQRTPSGTGPSRQAPASLPPSPPQDAPPSSAAEAAEAHAVTVEPAAAGSERADGAASPDDDDGLPAADAGETPTWLLPAYRPQTGELAALRRAGITSPDVLWHLNGMRVAARSARARPHGAGCICHYCGEWYPGGRDARGSGTR